MQDCNKCSAPYKVSSQRWCYDSKIDYLFKNPLIVRKQQKKNPYTKVNELAYTFEVGGFTACDYYSLEGDILETTIKSLNNTLFRHVIEEILENQPYKHTKPKEKMRYSSILSVQLSINHQKGVKTC